MTLLRAALAGTGRGAALHAAVIDRTPGIELVTVTSNVVGRARAFCDDLDRPHVAAGPHRSLTDVDCDVVVIATTPEGAAEAVAASAETGVPTLIECPVGRGPAALDDLLHSSPDRWAGVACHLAHSPLWSTFVDHSPGLGPLGHVGMTITREQPAGRNRQIWPGGVLDDLVVPNLPLLLDVIDRNSVSQVAAIVRSLGEPTESWTIDLFNTDRQLARLSASWAPASPFWDLQLAGEGGALRLEFQPDPHVELNGVDLPTPAPDSTIAPPELATYGYVQQMQSVGAAIGAGQPPLYPLTSARLAAAIVATAASSADIGGTAVGFAQ